MASGSDGPDVPQTSTPRPPARASWRGANFSDAALSHALRLVLLAWMTHFLVSLGQGGSAGASQAAYVAHLGIQVLIMSTAFFLIDIAGMPSSGLYWVLGTQVLAGVAALFYSGDGMDAQSLGLWVLMSMLSAMLLVIAIAARAYLPRSFPGWLGLGGSVAGMAICLDSMMFTLGTDNAVVSRHVCVFFLLLAWQWLTQRRRQNTPLFLQSVFPQQPVSHHEEGIAAFAVDYERRRIAKDLHDGVASQIVSILSSLDHHAPDQQALALALEQCLLDIKITVDSMESADQDILQALGSLRYRLQRPLDKLGIRVVWEVEMSGALEAVRGTEAQQVLRIAQECLSNVMRHAGATQVIVACRYLAEVDCMEFEVRDNGLGMTLLPATGTRGRGLDNMRHRARQIGGELTISSRVGDGTRVLLTLPLDPEFGALPCGPDDA